MSSFFTFMQADECKFFFVSNFNFFLYFFDWNVTLFFVHKNRHNKLRYNTFYQWITLSLLPNYSSNRNIMPKPVILTYHLDNVLSKGLKTAQFYSHWWFVVKLLGRLIICEYDFRKLLHRRAPGDFGGWSKTVACKVRVGDGTQV